MDDETRRAGHDQYQPELNADRGSLQPRQHDHHVALPPAQGPYPGALLPVAFVGLFIITGATVVYLFYVWWQKNYLDWRERWKTKRTGFSDTLLGKNMAQGSREGHASFANRVEGTENPLPKIVETNEGGNRLGEVQIAGIKFMDEKTNNINLRPIITTRNYGGSSPKFVEDVNAEQDSEGADENKEKEKTATSSKFVFPSTSAGPSEQPGCSKSLTSLVKNKHYVESKCGRFKIPIHDKQWLTHTKDYKCFTVNIPKPYPLAQAVKTELGEELKAANLESRRKKFSATRSPSLEKDDKSPFVTSAKSDRNDVFAFGEEDVEKVAETNLMMEQEGGDDSSVVEVRIQPLAQNETVTNLNFNSNVTPISPKELSNRYCLKKSYSLSNDNANSPREDFKNCNVLRHNQSNVNLNICSVRDDNFWAETQQQERLEMQNSPHILECGSAKDKTGMTKFNFSPKMLAESQNSPKFFAHCQSNQNSPKFFVEASPKSPRVDNSSVHSTSNATDNSNCSDTSKIMSPRNFSYDKSTCSPLEKQMSPIILLSGNTTPKSPKVSSYNKENCFRFDKGNSLDVKTRELIRQTSIDEVDNVSTVRNNRMTYRAYAGRKSIERDNCSTSKEKFDARKYRRYNSCDSTNRNLEISNLNKQNDFESLAMANDNNNSTQSLKVQTNDNEDRYMEKSIDKYEPLMNIEEVNTDIVSKLGVESSNLSPEVGSANYRRQRLKSISLDSDNAKIIEQNLGLPIAKHMKQEHLSELYRDQDTSSSCYDVQRNNISVTVSPTSPSIHITNYNRFNFEYDNVKANSEKEESEEKVEQVDDSRFSPQLAVTKKTLRDSSDTKSFIEMPRFSPKEFEVIITVEGKVPENVVPEPAPRMKRNRPNLTIDLTKRDSDLEQELLEFELLYSTAEEKKVKTPTLKVKATSLDSSESINFSLPPKKTLDVPQNSISVPNTPKRQFKRILGQKNMGKGIDLHSGGKFGCNSLQNAEQRRLYGKGQSHLNDSGIFLRDNHANLMLYKPNVCITKYGGTTRRMGSFDENMTDFGENTPEISISNDCDARLTLPMQQLDISQSNLGSNLLNFKQNLSISSTNLKTLPEGVPSNDFEPSADEKFTKKCMLHRRGSNQSLMLSLDNPTTSKYSNFSSQSSNCSLNSTGASCHNLASIRNSSSNFSLNTDNRQKKLILERRNSNASLTLNIDHLTPNNRLGSNVNLQSSNCNLSSTELPQNSRQPGKNCLLQRRGSNNSLSLNIQNSNTNLNRFSSNSSLNIHKEAKGGHRKGLLERRSSNTSLTLNINNSNPQLTTNRGLSISNYNLNGSTCNLSRYNSHQSINHPKEKGILARRSSNTSLTLNIQSQELPRDLEIDENIIDGELKDGESAHCMFMMQRERHRKSLSTENLMPKSYKNNRIHKLKNSENPCTFGSQDNLWSNSFVAESDENFNECYGQNLMYLCGDPENEMIYAFRDRQNYDEVPFSNSGFVRNITTKPLSPQTTSEDFKMYIANIQHLQSASNVLSRKQLKDLNDVFQNGYSKNKCSESQEGAACCKTKIVEQNKCDTDGSDSVRPCAEYQKSLLRNLHQEFWDLPTNFQEKPMVFGSHVKNRYKTILPNEHSRFILRPEEGQSCGGYINANYIKGHEFTKNSYIATQGPLPNTVYDFWLMVQQNTEKYAAGTVQKIVMLTNFNENNRQKCEKYFPIDVDEEVRFENGESEAGSCSTQVPKTDSEVAESKSNVFVIKNVGVINKTGYTIRKLIVKYNRCQEAVVTSDRGRVGRTNMPDSVLNDGEQCAKDASLDCNTKNNIEKYIVTENIPKKVDAEYFNVYHYWFHNWADHKCPKDVKALLNLSLDVLKDCKYDFSDKVTLTGEANEASESNTGERKLELGFEGEVKEDEYECNVKTTEIKFIFPPLDVEKPKAVSEVEESEPKVEDMDHSGSVNACSLRSPEIENPPTIIHCSAGIGRTGCLIAILNGVKQLNSDQKVDILGIVCNMRLNRGGMVQNSEQYELIHKVLCLYEAIALPLL